MRRAMTVLLSPVALVLAAFMVTGCASTRQIPRGEYASAPQTPLHLHRIELTDGTVYQVARFSVTDSTIVIEKLHKEDKRYAFAVMPIVRPLASVAAVETTDSRGAAWVFVPILPLAGAIAAIRSIRLD